MSKQEMKKLMESVEMTPGEKAENEVLERVTDRVHEWVHLEMDRDEVGQAVWALMQAYMNEPGAIAKEVQRYQTATNRTHQDYEDTE